MEIKLRIVCTVLYQRGSSRRACIIIGHESFHSLRLCLMAAR